MVSIVLPAWAFWLLVALMTVNMGLQVWSIILRKKHAALVQK